MVNEFIVINVKRLFRIVCITGNSSKSLSAEVKVKVHGKVGYSKDKFHYQVSIKVIFTRKV